MTFETLEIIRDCLGTCEKEASRKYEAAREELKSFEESGQDLDSDMGKYLTRIRLERRQERDRITDALNDFLAQDWH